MIKNVIFDVDGTLVDSVDFHAEAWQKAFEKYHVKTDLKAVRDQIGKGGDQLMPILLSEEQLQAFGEELEHYRGELFKKEYLKRIQPFPEARTLIAKITTDQKKIVLASSAKKEELEHFKELLGIEDFLEGETDADDADKSKPEPDIFLAAMAELGNPVPEETIVIGDTPYDAIAAKKAGLQTIGMLSGGFPEDWLKNEGCVEIYKSPSDLLARYEESLLCEKKKETTNLSSIISALLF